MAATYDYTDESGNISHRVVRLDNKQFLQQRKVKNEWVNGLDGRLTYPYRFPEVCRAIDQGTPIFITEGEKDADTLAALGLTATTNSAGAGNWKPDHSTLLAVASGGKAGDFILLPDNDVPGRKHAESVAASLHNAFSPGENGNPHIRIRIHELPVDPKGDVSDWMANGGTADELWARVEKEPDWAPPKQTPLEEEEDGAALYDHWSVPAWPNSVETDKLLQEVFDRLQTHLIINNESLIATTLWTLLTWVHDAAVHSPLLLLTSPAPECGKTSLLGLLTLLTPRGLFVLHMTSATLFRAMDAWSPTILMDEATDMFKGDPDLRHIMNSGWTKGAGILRCHHQTRDPEVFPTSGPKALGMIGLRIPPDTLGRSIVIEMQRMSVNDTVVEFAHEDDAGLAELRRKLKRWSQDNIAKLRGCRPVQPETFKRRLADNWRMIFAIADLGGGDWAAKARGAALILTERDDEDDPPLLLLAHCRTIFDQSKRDQLQPGELVGFLCEDPEWPWLTWRKGHDPITTRGIAKYLQTFKIRSINSGGRRYRRADFEDSWERYLKPEGEVKDE